MKSLNFAKENPSENPIPNQPLKKSFSNPKKREKFIKFEIQIPNEKFKKPVENLLQFQTKIFPTIFSQKTL